MKPEIVSIEIFGYDKKGNKYNLSDILSDDTDQNLSNDVEKWRSEND